MQFACIIIAFVALGAQAAAAANLISHINPQEKQGKARGRGNNKNRPTSERKRRNLRRHGRDPEEEMGIAHVKEDTTLDTKSAKLPPAEFTMPDHVEDMPIEQIEFSMPSSRRRLSKDLSMPIEQLEFSMPSGRRVEEDTTFGRRVTEDLSMPIEQLEFSMPGSGRHLTESMSMPTLIEAEFQPSCDPSETCYEEGASCARGTETCCGETHDSLRCTCEDSGNGRLQYMCFHTDACMVPSCCWPGPPADMPPPADGTCNPGSLCDTGIEDDYCCYDMMGGAGSYCSKSGGTASETMSTTLATKEPRKARKLQRKEIMERHRLNEDMSTSALVEAELSMPIEQLEMAVTEQLEFSMPNETATTITTSCLPEGSGKCHLRFIGMDNKCHNAAALVCGEECGGPEACCPDGSGGYVAPSYCYIGFVSCPCPEEV